MTGKEIIEGLGALAFLTFFAVPIAVKCGEWWADQVSELWDLLHEGWWMVSGERQ